MNHLRRARALAFAVMLAGCSSVPLSSLVQLTRINAETTDLAALRVAVRLPSALKPRPGGVNMDVLLKVTGEPDQKTTLFLAETHDAGDLSGLSGAAQTAPGRKARFLGRRHCGQGVLPGRRASVRLTPFDHLPVDLGDEELRRAYR